jgi:NAD(P)-dependent dehydrogenase (short-subunit alcohol dehydrogenase family)
MAMALAEAGASLYCIDLPSSPSPEFNACAEYAKKLGTSLTYIKADVTSQSQMSSVISEIAERHGRLDACVAAAGILGPTETSALDLSEDDFRKVQNVNTTGVFLTAQAALNGMVKTGSKGSIILIASMSGSIVNRG